MTSETPEQTLRNEQPDPANIVIFGATGDLTKRKLVPAMVSIQKRHLAVQVGVLAPLQSST